MNTSAAHIPAPWTKYYPFTCRAAKNPENPLQRWALPGFSGSSRAALLPLGERGSARAALLWAVRRVFGQRPLVPREPDPPAPRNPPHLGTRASGRLGGRGTGLRVLPNGH